MKVRNYKFEGVYALDKRTILTVNQAPGRQVYGERLIKGRDAEFREWNPKRSKLGAAILKGIKELPVKEDSKVLYLGAASGTTASHVADIAVKGSVYCLDNAQRVIRDLIFVCTDRKNMHPLFDNANLPDNYEAIVPKVDVVYQDVAQPNQVEILLRNVKKFLKKGGYALFAVKARSIDVSKRPEKIFRSVEQELKNAGLRIIDSKKLEPFEKDHMMFVIKN